MLNSHTIEQPRQVSIGLPLALLFALTALQAGWRLGSGSPEDTRAAITLIVLTPLALAIFRRASRTDVEGEFLMQMLLFAWLAKLAAMEIRLYLLINVYHGADTQAYHDAGTEIAAAVLSGTPLAFDNLMGTEFVELVAGLLYVITGPTMVGAWIVFGFLGLLGMLWHYKAFALSCSGSNRRMFMALVFFYPSILMWTGSLGKDALTAFTLGVTAYAVALLNARGLRLGTLLILALGLGGTLMVRPHLAAIVTVVLTAVVLLRPIRAGALTPVVRLAGFAIFAVLAAGVVRTSASFLHIEDLSVEGVTGFIEQEQEQSATGGSAFKGGFPRSPQDAALAIVTVLFRPFPWESGGGLGLISALEGVVLMALMAWRFPTIVRVFRDAVRNGYLLFSAAYVPLFTLFFSTVSNFGILVRQRVQVLPFIFIWLAYRATATSTAGVERSEVPSREEVSWMDAG